MKIGNRYGALMVHLEMNNGDTQGQVVIVEFVNIQGYAIVFYLRLSPAHMPMS